MGKGKFGSLFDRILSKSPDVANKLEDMAKQNSITSHKEITPKELSPVKPTPKNTEPLEPKTPRVDPMANVVVEKKSITPRFRRKPAKSKPRTKSKGETTQRPTQSYPESFFDGIPEHADQFDPNHGSKTLDVVIGLDFGTSSTKVVVHAPTYTGSPAFAIPFEKFAHTSLEYLLPTILAISDDGKFTLSSDNSSAVLTDIKISLSDSPNGPVKGIGDIPSDTTPNIATTAYLALVLRYVRCWFLVHKEAIFKGNKINWALNLGIPAAKDDEEPRRQIFNDVGKAAWLMSISPGPITLNSAKVSFQNIKEGNFSEKDMPWDFQVVPEVIAEVLGYARSEYRNEGLHFLVDAGANTLDVCAFSLQDDEGDDHYSILTAIVEPLGAQQLHKARVAGARSATSESAEKLVNARDPLSLIPDDSESYIPDKKIIIDGVKAASAKFAEDSSNAVYKTIWHTKKKRFPDSQSWSEELPVFVCGGAMAINLYDQVIDGIETWLKDLIPRCPGVRVISLPKPVSLEANIDNDDYHRLAVAWGLSHQSFNMGTYDRPGEIEDIPPPPVRDITDRFIGPEMV